MASPLDFNGPRRLGVGILVAGISSRQQYDVAADGRFLINAISDDATSSPITVLQNWKPPVKQP
jgi:hypothetical protein